ncbi:cupin domain-containing protein [Hoeflea sp. TYP-13]|uniref:AraC family transcriptional regulator n=1 Tax=Hoeflea sp. TYP-13 TaxID=3230023 RepID=UPI0034C679ED
MDLLSDILSRMQLSGTLYFRTSFTSPWSIRVPSFENVARFHFAHKGRCFVRINPNEPPVPLEQGDLVIIMRGASHTLYCDPTTENQAVLLDQVVEKSGFTGKGALVYGETGTNYETQLVCGHFAFGDNAQHLLIDALPSHIHIRNYGEAAGAWMDNTLKVIGNEAGRDQMGSDLIALKMSEIIFAQALRTYLESEGAGLPVLAGFADANIARVLTAIHEEPAYPWTLERLAQIAGMSRTAFVTRFSQCMTMTPLSYITHWRMQIARQQLASTSEPIIEIAEMVGYHSEAAFSRVFKKHHSSAPATYRRQIRELA